MLLTKHHFVSNAQATSKSLISRIFQVMNCCGGTGQKPSHHLLLTDSILPISIIRRIFRKMNVVSQPVVHSRTIKRPVPDVGRAFVRWWVTQRGERTLPLAIGSKVLSSYYEPRRCRGRTGSCGQDVISTAQTSGGYLCCAFATVIGVDVFSPYFPSKKIKTRVNHRR